MKARFSRVRIWLRTQQARLPRGRAATASLLLAGFALGAAVMLGAFVLLADDGEPSVGEASRAGAADTATTAPRSATQQPTTAPTQPPTTGAPTPSSAGPTGRPSPAQPSTNGASSSPVAPPPTPPTPAPPAPPSQGSGCVTNCGTPRFFCDEGGWAFCDDYRDIFCPTRCPFPGPERALTFDAFSSTTPSYLPDEETGPPYAFGNDQEHFHTGIEDSQFGMAVLRLQQPFDFTGREGRVHFESDLKVGPRRYIRIMLSPQLTKAVVDDRQGAEARPDEAFDLWFVNGTFRGTVWRGGSCGNTEYCLGNAFDVVEPRYIGTENVRDDIDLYISRSRVRVVVNGVTRVDESIPELSFETAYVYLSQVSYNPCKDGECERPQQIFHWDNVAFDGPVLPRNGLTPAGQRDIVFNAYSATSCNVKGTEAQPTGALSGYKWITWVARLPADGSSVTTEDVDCEYDFFTGDSDHVRALEIVQR